MNEEELAAYNEEKRVREEKMQAWEEKRRAEMEAEGMSVYKVMERARLLNPSTMIYPKESCVHQMPPIDPPRGPRIGEPLSTKGNPAGLVNGELTHRPQPAPVDFSLRP